MEKSNIIISVIIVLCIAAGVTAYGLTNPDNEIFSSLPELDGEGGSGSEGAGNSTNVSNSNGGSVAASGNGKGSGVGTGTGDGSNRGSGSGSGSSSNKPVITNPTTPDDDPKIPPSEAESIAKNAVKEPGCTIGSAAYSKEINMYFVPVYDSSGDLVDTIGVDGTTGKTSRG
ncbi:endoglucanase [Methanobrevibacter sp. DSM 116169]|uniref:endoglucanase n=1 Tax=Methanobrevibacter sp. DSM 116169 TaxID=3242727 RepID=UPI0038FD232C